jgi:hypothetical protein
MKIIFHKVKIDSAIGCKKQESRWISDLLKSSKELVIKIMLQKKNKLIEKYQTNFKQADLKSISKFISYFKLYYFNQKKWNQSIM